MSRVPKELIREMMEKLGKSRAAIYRRIRARWEKSGCSFSTKAAALSLAAEMGINPRMYANPEDLDELRKLQSLIKTMPAMSAPRESRRTQAPRKIKRVHELKLKDGLGNVSLNLSQSKIDEGKQMAQIYFRLYLFENSLRQFIVDVMEQKVGSDWWIIHVNKATQETAAKREAKDRGNRWHGSRGAHPIHYIDFQDYKRIITKNWTLFESFLPKLDRPLEWILNRIEEITFSRNIVAHMNPLEADDCDRVQVYLKDWLKQVGRSIFDP